MYLPNLRTNSKHLFFRIFSLLFNFSAIFLFSQLLKHRFRTKKCLKHNHILYAISHLNLQVALFPYIYNLIIFHKYHYFVCDNYSQLLAYLTYLRFNCVQFWQRHSFKTVLKLYFICDIIHGIFIISLLVY